MVAPTGVLGTPPNDCDEGTKLSSNVQNFCVGKNSVLTSLEEVGGVDETFGALTLVPLPRGRREEEEEGFFLLSW